MCLRNLVAGLIEPHQRIKARQRALGIAFGQRASRQPVAAAEIVTDQCHIDPGPLGDFGKRDIDRVLLDHHRVPAAASKLLAHQRPVLPLPGFSTSGLSRQPQLPPARLNGHILKKSNIPLIEAVQEVARLSAGGVFASEALLPAAPVQRRGIVWTIGASRLA